MILLKKNNQEFSLSIPSCLEAYLRSQETGAGNRLMGSKSNLLIFGIKKGCDVPKVTTVRRGTGWCLRHRTKEYFYYLLCVLSTANRNPCSSDGWLYWNSGFLMASSGLFLLPQDATGKVLKAEKLCKIHFGARHGTRL